MNVSAGNALFTLIGFMGMYAVLSILFLFLVRREIEHGPEPRRSRRRTRIRRAQALGGDAMETLWFCLVAFMLAGYVVLDGFDLGAGIVHLRGAHRGGAADRAAVDRPGLGRQRGLAAGRRRHAVLRLPGALRRRASAASTCR